MTQPQTQPDVPIHSVGDEQTSADDTSSSPSIRDRWLEVHDRIADWWRKVKPQVTFGVNGDPDPTPVSVDSILLADGKVAVDKNLLVDIELVLRGLRTASRDYITGVENSATARAKKKAALTQAAAEAEGKLLTALREQIDRSENVINRLSFIS